MGYLSCLTLVTEVIALKAVIDSPSYLRWLGGEPFSEISLFLLKYVDS